VWYSGRAYVPTMNGDVRCEDLNDAEGLKAALLKLGPRGEEDWEAAWDRNPQFWNRLQVQHLRVENRRKWFVVVRTVDGVHRLLVLKVPPRGVTCGRHVRNMLLAR